MADDRDAAADPHGVPTLWPPERSLRPDLTGVMLELPPGQWWTDDGWLRMEIVQVGDPSQGALPDGWVWVAGELFQDGKPFDWCTVPVRIDALPPSTVDHPRVNVAGVEAPE